MERFQRGLRLQRSVRVKCTVGKPADLWIQAKRGFSELMSRKKGFGENNGG